MAQSLVFQYSYLDKLITFDDNEGRLKGTNLSYEQPPASIPHPNQRAKDGLIRQENGLQKYSA